MERYDPKTLSYISCDIQDGPNPLGVKKLRGIWQKQNIVVGLWNIAVLTRTKTSESVVKFIAQLKD